MTSRANTGRDSTRPVHLRGRSLGIVALGGMIGTAAREALVLGLPTTPGALPLPVLLVNVSGAFLLGVLLEILVRRGPEGRRAREMRLLIGTGVLGGFTTYSALAVDTAQLLDGELLTAVLYGLGSVVGGVLAAGAGIVVGSRWHRHRTGSTRRTVTRP